MQVSFIMSVFTVPYRLSNGEQGRDKPLAQTVIATELSDGME
jgi:hypothetical protein